MATGERSRKALVVGVVAAGFVAYWYLENLLVLVPGYRELFDRFGYYVPRSLLSGAEIAWVVAVVGVLHRLGPVRALGEVGLVGPVGRAASLGLLATTPMFLTLAMTHELAPDPLPELLYLSVLSPLAEEIVFRGFLFGQLWRRGGCKLWIAIAVSSAAFGYDHAEDASSLMEGAGLLVLTGLGAAIFAWIYSRWGTLVAPLGLHVLMNAAWGLWQVGDGPLAGWVPLALQLTTVSLAVGLTVIAGRRGWLPAPTERYPPPAAPPCHPD